MCAFKAVQYQINRVFAKIIKTGSLLTELFKELDMDSLALAQFYHVHVTTQHAELCKCECAIQFVCPSQIMRCQYATRRGRIFAAPSHAVFITRLMRR